MIYCVSFTSYATPYRASRREKRYRDRLISVPLSGRDIRRLTPLPTDRWHSRTARLCPSFLVYALHSARLHRLCKRKAYGTLHCRGAHSAELSHLGVQTSYLGFQNRRVFQNQFHRPQQQLVSFVVGAHTRLQQNLGDLPLRFASFFSASPRFFIHKLLLSEVCVGSLFGLHFNCIKQCSFGQDKSYSFVGTRQTLFRTYT